MEKLHRSQMIAKIKKDFPELADALNQEMGLLSFELDVLCRFTMTKIGEGDHDAVEKCYAIALTYYQGSGPKLRDAISSCYVENLEFPSPKKKDRAWAWEILPEPFKIMHRDFHR